MGRHPISGYVPCVVSFNPLAGLGALLGGAESPESGFNVLMSLSNIPFLFYAIQDSSQANLAMSLEWSVWRQSALAFRAMESEAMVSGAITHEPRWTWSALCGMTWLSPRMLM